MLPLITGAAVGTAVEVADNIPEAEVIEVDGDEAESSDGEDRAAGANVDNGKAAI